MTVMEPRVAERRKSVSEDRARKRLKWILLVIAVMGLGLAVMWLIRSPILSIREVEVAGAEQSNPRAVVGQLDMEIGTPTIDVNADAITAAILEDPWVKTARVTVLWPGSVVIEVTERTPVAPVLAGDRWVLVSRDGGVIMVTGEPDTQTALVAIDQGALELGDQITDTAALGALEFIDHLSDERRVGTRVRIEGDGLVALVSGHDVRLGRPTDMAQKASVLDALLDSGVEPGAAIDLIAPLRPAVSNPQPQVEAEE
jgi:cell division protein FtsQ